ncbi:MAG: hypothetical protein ACE37B_09890 [Ilumatobacter sp.]|uniref:hypothetical protein n=1 Tax=Ilumatobacter sp. TaxID=1967498 RepID=UPI00391D09AF
MSAHLFAVDSAVVAVGALGDRMSVAAFAVSATVLAICVVLMSRALPDLPRWRWGGSNDAGWANSTTSRRRGAVTGERPALPAGAVEATSVVQRRTVTGPARQIEAAPDALSSETKAVAAERTIEHLLETDPDLVAGIIMQWLQNDRDQQVQRPGGSPGTSSGSRR